MSSLWQVVEAATREGAAFVDHWFIGCGATHVVCEGRSILRYIGHTNNLVTVSINGITVYFSITNKGFRTQNQLSIHQESTEFNLVNFFLFESGIELSFLFIYIYIYAI